MDSEVPGYEILEIAEKIERNGVKFYRRAAGICSDDRTCSLLVELARWETQHVEIFRKMKKRLVEKEWEFSTIPIASTGPSDSQLLAGLAVFGVQPDPENELTGHETRAEVLKIAIEKEKDSIVYYTGLKGFVPLESDRAVITRIILEEMKHVRILMQSLAQLE